MAAINYTLTNYGSVTATITAIEFDPTNGINHTANLSNFGGYLASETAFTGVSTYPVEAAVVTDFDIIREPTYVAHFTTSTINYLVVSTTEGIGSGYNISLNGYTSGQQVVSVTSATWIRVSATPSFPPTVGQAIRFTPDDKYLYLDDITGIRINDKATGNGYDGTQFVVARNFGFNRLTMSDYPSSTPVVGGSVSFTDITPICELAPGASIPFTVDYVNVTTTLNEYPRDIRLYAEEGGSVVKTVNNFVTLSTAPVTAPPDTVYAIYYDTGGGGGDGSAPGCTDSSSVSCSASGGGGGGGCFTAGTMINLAGGKTRAIADIKPGDFVVDALTGKLNKVIGVKVTENPVGRKIFATKQGVTPFITEEHPFYNDQQELCAISSLCEELAPWLGPVKIVEMSNVTVPTEPVTVYNLILENGNTHYANNVPVNNIIGHGGAFVLFDKGYLSFDDYRGYINHLEDTVGLNSLAPDQKVKIYKIVFSCTHYIMHNNNLSSRMLAKALSWAIKHRTMLFPYIDKWLKSRVRNWIFGPKK